MLGGGPCLRRGASVWGPQGAWCASSRSQPPPDPTHPTPLLPCSPSRRPHQGRSSGSPGACARAAAGAPRRRRRIGAAAVAGPEGGGRGRGGRLPLCPADPLGRAVPAGGCLHGDMCVGRCCAELAWRHTCQQQAGCTGPCRTSHPRSLCSVSPALWLRRPRSAVWSPAPAPSAASDRQTSLTQPRPPLTPSTPFIQSTPPHFPTLSAERGLPPPADPGAAPRKPGAQRPGARHSGAAPGCRAQGYEGPGE